MGSLSLIFTIQRTTGDVLGKDNYHFHQYTDIQVFICSLATKIFTSYLFNRIACIRKPRRAIRGHFIFFVATFLFDCRRFFLPLIFFVALYFLRRLSSSKKIKQQQKTKAAIKNEEATKNQRGDKKIKRLQQSKEATKN